MSSTKATRVFATLLAVLTVALTAHGARAAENRREMVRQLGDQIAGGARTSIDPASGVVTFLGAPRGTFFEVDVERGLPAEARARAFINRWGGAFGVPDSRSLRATRAGSVDEFGMEHVRFQQTHAGIPVTGGELTVHLSADGVTAVNSTVVPDLEGVGLVPTVAAETAVVRAREALSAEIGDREVVYSEPRLELFHPQAFGEAGTSARLAWFVEGRSFDVREFIWIDARSGSLLLKFSQLTDALDRMVYDADDPGDGVFGTLPGALVRSEGQPATGDSDVDTAYDYSGDTYNHFMNEYGRDSYDDMGSSLISSVGYCPDAGNCPYANAFWNGSQMVYGAGFPEADDVDAHELTHAVTEFTANLFYYMQSGALNESFSDIFGETVDLTNTGGTDTPGVRWQMGEDVPGFGAIRDMMDPTIFGDPGKVSDAQFFCGKGDQGGVHSNSGVPNHAYALMVDGGAYNGKTVTGIGLTKAGKIQYRALSYYLLSASDFLDNYNAVLQSCQDLIGTAGITQADCTEVEDALDAVEMTMNWPCTPAQPTVPALCSGGQSPVVSIFQNFDSGGLAACPADALPAAWCLETPSSLLGRYATSGDNSAWGYTPGTATDRSLILSTASPLPAASKMQFNHSYGFDTTATTYWDGGVVEYSTNSGGTWTDLGGMWVAGAAYGGTIASGSGNALENRSAFVSDSYGYTASQFDLAALGGQTTWFRFRLGTDSLFDDYGWFIDDFRVYTCHACPSGLFLTQASNGTSPTFSASSSIVATDFTIAPLEDVTLSAAGIELRDGFVAAGRATFDHVGCP